LKLNRVGVICLSIFSYTAPTALDIQQEVEQIRADVFFCLTFLHFFYFCHVFTFFRPKVFHLFYYVTRDRSLKLSKITPYFCLQSFCGMRAVQKFVTKFLSTFCVDVNKFGDYWAIAHWTRDSISREWRLVANQCTTYNSNAFSRKCRSFWNESV